LGNTIYDNSSIISIVTRNLCHHCTNFRSLKIPLSNYTSWSYNLTLITLLIASGLLIYQLAEYMYNNHVIIHSPWNGLNIVFRLLISLSSLLCLLVSYEYIKSSPLMLTEFLVSLLTVTLGGFTIADASDFITLFIGVELLQFAFIYIG